MPVPEPRPGARTPTQNAAPWAHCEGPRAGRANRSKTQVACSLSDSTRIGEEFRLGTGRDHRGTQSKGRTPESGRSVQGKQSKLPKRHLDEENALTVGLQGVCGLTSTSSSEVLLLLKACSLHAPLCLRAFHKRVPHEPRSQILRHQQNDPRVDADYVRIIPVLQRIESVGEPVFVPRRGVLAANVL